MQTLTSWIHLGWLIPLAVFCLYLGSPRFLGTQANNRLKKLLQGQLDSQRFVTFYDRVLSAHGRVLTIDCLVISQLGIFVIDAIHLPGKVSGKKVQATWRRKNWGREARFDNPAHENFLRLQALQQALDLPVASFHPIVAVSGQTAIDTDAKDIVMDVQKVARKIQSQARQLLSREQVSAALLQIQQLQLHAPFLGAKRSWRVLQMTLLTLLAVASWWLYQDQMKAVYHTVSNSFQQVRSPQEFHPDGSPKSERELWEDSLVCTFSVDSGRCACYQSNGEKAQIEAGRCRDLAERGSVLKQ